MPGLTSVVESCARSTDVLRPPISCGQTSSYRAMPRLHRFAVALAEHGLNVGLEAHGLVGVGITIAPFSET
jgi:hypothetical protein